IAVSTILLFTVPDINTTGQIVYAYVTYIIWGMVFTVNDIPIWGLSSAVTKNIQQRKKHVSCLTVAQMIGNALPGMIGATLLVMLGGENTSSSYTMLAVLTAIVGATGMVITFFTTKERAELPKENPNLFKIIKAAFSNKTLLIFVIFMLANTSFGAVYATINVYYAQYVLNDISLLGLLTTMLVIGQIIGTISGPFISAKIGNRNTLIGNFIIFAVSYVAYFLIGYESITVVSIFTLIGGILTGLPGVLMTAMLSDLGEYVQWKTDVKTEGIIFSMRTFGTKLSAGLIALIISTALTLVNYVPNVTQTAEATKGIFGIVTLLPAGLSLICIVPMIFYDLTEEKSKKIRNELEAR